MNKKTGWLLFLCAWLTVGCAEMNTVESILLVQSIGYDLDQDHMINGTFVAPSYVQGSSPSPQFFDAKGKTLKKINLAINSQSPKRLGLGQLRVVLLGMHFAKQGIYHVIDTLQRNPEIGSNIYIVVADGRSEQMMKKFKTSLAEVQMPGVYLTKLIKQNIMTENVPKTNLHLFGYHLFDPGCDPILPLVGMNQGAFIVKGIALFNNDQYVGKIGMEDMFTFKRIYQKTQSGNFEIKIKSPDGDFDEVMVRQIITDPNYNIKVVNGVPTVKIHVNIKGSVEEYSGDRLLDGQNRMRKIDRAIKRKFENQAKSLIARFQKMGIDPLCIGAKVRSQDRHWDLKRWRAEYPNIKITIQAHVNILRTGTKE